MVTSKMQTGAGKRLLLLGLWVALLCAAICWMKAPVQDLAVAALMIFAVQYAAGWFVKGKAKRVRGIINGVAAVLCMVILLCGCIRGFAPMALFQPNSDEASQNALLHSEQVQALQVESDGGTLSGWLISGGTDSAPLILYFGGNQECASRRILEILNDNWQSTVFDGYDFAFVDYPSYGESAGSLSQETIKQFGLEVYDYFSKVQNRTDIYVFGYSLGTGVANYVASQGSVQGLILFAPYANGYDLYNQQLNIFHGPLKLLVGFPMEAERFAENIPVKPLIFASTEDEVVPCESSVRLSQSYRAGTDFNLLDDAEHNDFWRHPQVRTVLSAYLHERR